MNPIIIIGTGLAGYTLAKEFRKLDTVTPLQLITADAGYFYSKPMLSSALTNGKTPQTLASATAGQMADQLKADIRTHTRITSIDVRNKFVCTAEDQLPYTRLVLASGAAPIQLPMSGDAVDEILTVNNLDDYSHFRTALNSANDVAIIGPGLIGCEFANDLANAGKQVTVIGPDKAPLGRLLPEQAGQALQQALQDIGIHWRLEVTATAVDHRDNGIRITLSDGSRVDADLVLSAIGLRPDVQLAKQTGLRTNRGILVDRYLQTSVAGIYALGDCMEVEGLVLPFVMPIMHCARALAKTLSGHPEKLRYPPMPVAVKTPAHPVVVSPPPAGAQGTWRISKVDGGIRAEYRDRDDHLLGIALTGAATSDKQALTRQLPPILD